MLKSFSTIVGLALVAGPLSALPPGVTVERDGQLGLGGVKFTVTMEDAAGKLRVLDRKSLRETPSYPVFSEKVCEIQGEWPDDATTPPFAVQEWVRETAPDAIKYSMKMLCPRGRSPRLVFLEAALPAGLVREHRFRLDGRPVDPTATRKPEAVSRIELVADGRRITLNGKFTAAVLPRPQGAAALRLHFNPASGPMRSTYLEMAVTIRPDAMRTVPLSGADRSRTSAAESASFRRNLRMKLSGSSFRFAGVEFDPAVVLRPGPGETASVKLREPARNGYLYLLHRTADAAAEPSLTLHYADGSQQTVRLRSDIDFAADRPLRRLSNGVVAASNNEDFQGLYFSVFPLNRAKPLVRIDAASKQGRWEVAAMTLGDAAIPMNALDSIHYVTADREWLPLEKTTMSDAGTPLDFSVYLDAPAGKYGRIVTTSDGHFSAEKAPGRRFRFLGTNLCFSANFPEHADAEKLADELARCGYNAVRFHHFDNNLADRAAAVSTTLDPQQLDKLDYLFHCLKKRGLYLTIDLYCSRNLKPGELPGYPEFSGRILKDWGPIYPPAQENWKTYVRHLLRHKNPYTSLTWAEDPALYAVALMNENVLHLKTTSWKPELNRLYLDGYERFLKEKKQFSAARFASRGSLFDAYMTDLHLKMIADFSTFLRRDLGYHGLITDVNMKSFLPLNEIRQHLDFVDNHLYWDHPNFLPGHSWSYPIIHNQTNPLRYDLWCPRRIMPSRLFGKPFTVTEINYTFPNRYRAAMGPVLGAYASLQDWDGIYRFAWAHSAEGVLHRKPINGFDSVEDSLVRLSERIINLMFLRGDVGAAADGVAWPGGRENELGYGPDYSLGTETFPTGFQQLGFFCRIGVLNGNAAFPGVRKLASIGDFPAALTSRERQFLAAPVRVSETGQIAYNPGDASFRVVAPRTESLTLSTGTLRGKILTVADADSFQIVTATSLDRNPLASGSRILLFHQTDVTNLHLRYTSPAMQAVENWGVNRQLIRRGRAQIELALPGGPFRVTALGLNGRPKAETPATYRDGRLRFTADTAFAGGTMVYLIEKNR